MDYLFPYWTVLLPKASADRAKKFEIKVISGQQIPKPHQSTKGEVVDPYVKLAVRGCSVDTHDQNRAQTPHVNDNGFR